MVTARVGEHEIAPLLRQEEARESRNLAAFNARPEEGDAAPSGVFKARHRDPPSSSGKSTTPKARKSHSGARERQQTPKIEWSDPKAIRGYLISIANEKRDALLPDEVIREGVINPRALEAFTRDFAKELKSLPPGAERDALAPLITELETLPDRLYQGCVGIAAKTPGAPLEPALAVEHLADLFDGMLLSCNQVKKNAPTENAEALSGWLAGMMLALKRTTRTESTKPLIELAGREGFAALKRTAHQHRDPRSGHSVSYGKNVGIQGGFGFTPENSGFFTATILGVLGLTGSTSTSRDKDGDLNDIRLTGVKGGVKGSFGILGLLSTSLGFTAAHEAGTFSEGSMDDDGMALVATQYSVFQGPIGRLFGRQANAGARERHEGFRKAKSFAKLLLSGHRDPLPSKLPFFMHDPKMEKGVSRRGIHEAASQVGAHLDAPGGTHRRSDAIDRIMRKHFPRIQDLQGIAEQQENPEKALGALYPENWNRKVSAPDTVTNRKMKGSRATWNQTTLTANGNARLSPFSAEHITGGVVTADFNTPISMHADLSATGYLRYRRLLASRLNRPAAEMMNIGYLREGDKAFAFMGKVWQTYGQSGTAPSGPRAAHPVLRLANDFSLSFGQNETHPPQFDEARRSFYGDPAAMSEQHRKVASALAHGGDPVALMKEIDHKLDGLVKAHGAFMRDVDETMPGSFFSPEAALNRINRNIFKGDYPLDGTPEATRKIQADGVNSFAFALQNLMLSHSAAKYELFCRGNRDPAADKLGQAVDDRYNDIAKILSRETIAMRRSDARRRSVFRTRAASTKATAYGELDAQLNLFDVAQTMANLESTALPVLPFESSGQLGVNFHVQRDRVKHHSDPGRVGDFKTVGMLGQSIHAPGLIKRAIEHLRGKKPMKIEASSVDEKFWHEIKHHGLQSILNNNEFRQLDRVYHRLPRVAGHRLVEKRETTTLYGGHNNSSSIATPNVAALLAAKGIPAVFNVSAGVSSGTQKLMHFKLGGDLQNQLLHMIGQYQKLFVAEPNGKLDIAATVQAFEEDPTLKNALFSDEGALFDALNQIIQFDPKDPFAPFVDVDGKTRKDANPMAFYVDEKRMSVFKSSAKATHFSAGSGKIASAGPDKESPVLELFKECERLRREEPELLPRIRDLFIQQKNWTPDQQFEFLTKNKEGRHLLRIYHSSMSKLAEARIDLLNAHGYPLLLNEALFDSFPGTSAPAAAVAVTG
jgi:hypothetical protein